VLYLIKRSKDANTQLQEKLTQQQTKIAALNNTISQKKDNISKIVKEYNDTANSLKSSIQYAERIQRAIIPQNTEFKMLFPECFIFFEPRDIVSGDFYMCKSSSDCKIAIVADCTGHGVPGGLLSMLGMSAIKDLFAKQNITKDFNPGDFLESLRKVMLSSLAEADESDNTTVSDGMDISICAFDSNMTQMRYAAANHTIYVVHDGEINKLKGCRMPIGRYPKQDEPFETFSFDLQHGDTVYLCSDGIQDQFGSADNKKFSTKRLAAMLQENSAKDIQQQYTDISTYVHEWEAGYNQYDDQTLIGIRI
jgi:serine phosphatase RsbU (regulator of sigma subunit)